MPCQWKTPPSWNNHFLFFQKCASKVIYLFYYSVSFGHAFSQIDRLMSQSIRDVPFHPLCVSLIGDWRHHVIGSLSCCLKCTHARKMKRERPPNGTQALLFRSVRWVYLDGPHHPVSELESSHGCRRSERGSAPLKTTNYPTVFPVLFDGKPDQIPESLNWTHPSLITHKVRYEKDIHHISFECSKSVCRSHPAGPESESAPHHPTVLEADSSLCQLAIHWLHRKTIYPHLIIWRVTKKTKH